MNQRIAWIDTAKGLGLLMVFFGHLRIPFVSTWVYTFHMPLFFFLSGLVFSNIGGSYWFFVKKKIRRLIIPYFTLGGVIFIFWCILYRIEGRSASDYLLMLGGFFAQKHFWTVWFLAALFFAEVVYGAVNCICKDNLLTSTYWSVILCLISFGYYRLGGETLPWNIDTALVAQLFLHLGYVLKRLVVKPMDELLNLKKVIGYLSVSLFLILNSIFGYLCIRLSGHSLDMSVGMYGNEVCTLLSAICGIMAIVVFSHYFTCKWVIWLGQNTMVLFAWHSRIIILGCQLLFAHWHFLQRGDSFTQTLSGLIMLTVIIAILVPATIGIKKIKHHHWFGV